MKGLLTPRQLTQIERDSYDLYEVLVAKHMWHKIARHQYVTYSHVLAVKRDVADIYGVKWQFDCLLCELYNHDCDGCPLGNCGTGSPYNEAENGSALACKEIEEAIEADWQKRVSEMDARR